MFHFRRKTPGLAGNKKVLEVNLAESSRKFITCIRKYTLFYLKLLLESREINMLERAYASLRADKRVIVYLTIHIDTTEDAVITLLK